MVQADRSDLRSRVIEAATSGMSAWQAAERFGVGVSTARGRSRRGERCRAAVPHGHWKTATFTAGLRLSGMTAPMVLDGAMNGTAFLADVEQVLVPMLSPGAIVVMANLPAHKAPASETLSGPRARRCGTSRLTVRTSTRSNGPSPNSRHCSAKPPPAPFRTCGPP